MLTSRSDDSPSLFYRRDDTHWVTLKDRAGANHSSAMGKINFQRFLIAYDVILLNQPLHDLFKRKQTHSLCSLCILNFPVRPRQGPFQHPSTLKALLRTSFFTSNELVLLMPSFFEHQIHQSIIYTSDRRHSIHLNKNSSIGLKLFYRLVS